MDLIANTVIYLYLKKANLTHAKNEKKIKVDVCYNYTCLNGGFCQVQQNNNLPYCQCAPGYCGAQCQNIENCLANPCQNGATCKNGTATTTTSSVLFSWIKIYIALNLSLTFNN